jgi:hypothetical protein
MNTSRSTSPVGLCLLAPGLGALLASATWLEAAAPADPSPPAAVREIHLVHFSHTDVGFTDSPSVCRELFRRYLDIAVDAVLDSRKKPADRRFYWTAEATMPVNDWWQAATPDRRRQFLQAVRTGQLEISALAFNNTPFMNAAQWQTMTHWLPPDLWDRVHPKVAIQDDVNGVPRAAALALLDRGVRYLFTGINEDSGGVPFPRPSAFWWKMPDGRRMFVWLNIGYGSGFDFFEPDEWRRGPVPRAADTRYRPPRAGDILRTDETSLRAAHRQCLARVRLLEQEGYRHEVLTISITSQWRFDNDPPFPPLADFVAAWNNLGLMPRLRLTTAGDAMKRMEEVVGQTAPEYSGEWTDWWANGSASAPREIAASRAAKRLLAAVESPLWGPARARARQTMDDLYRDLCLFDEHTWGSSLSVARPYSLDTQGQFTEKSLLAYRPMARAEWLLAQRVRTALATAGEGLVLANPAPAPFGGWVRMTATALRGPYQSVEDPKTGEGLALEFEPGIQPWGRPQKPEDLSREDLSATFPDRAPHQVARFWVERLEARGVRRLQLSTRKIALAGTGAPIAPAIPTDDLGWPISALWPGMEQPLFLKGFGDFTAVKVDGFAPRHVLADIRGQRGEARDRLRRQHLEEVPGVAEEKALVEETPHTVVFTQALRHPRLEWATRVLEVWRQEPRVRLTLRLNRRSSAAPEIFYLAFAFPTGDVLPRLSNGGQAFTPFTDQLAGTCRDYFAVDGWAEYATPNGRWLWVSRDAPLVTFGSGSTLARRESPPEDSHRLLAMLFNNFWYTNFAADEHGIMEFQFDLVWRPDGHPPAQDLAEALVAEPTVLINPASAEDPRVIRHLYQP